MTIVIFEACVTELKTSKQQHKYKSLNTFLIVMVAILGCKQTKGQFILFQGNSRIYRFYWDKNALRIYTRAYFFKYITSLYFVTLHNYLYCLRVLTLSTRKV